MSAGPVASPSVRVPPPRGEFWSRVYEKSTRDKFFSVGFVLSGEVAQVYSMRRAQRVQV